MTAVTTTPSQANHDHHDDAMMAFNLKPELLTVSFSATDNVPSNYPGRLGVTTVTPVTVC